MKVFEVWNIAGNSCAEEDFYCGSNATREGAERRINKGREDYRAMLGEGAKWRADEEKYEIREVELGE